jgi:hypothetical protein
MMHHLYKEPQAQDAHEVPNDEGDMIYEQAKIKSVASRSVPLNSPLFVIKAAKPPQEKLWPLIIFTLGFTAGYVWAMLSILGSRF